MRSVAAILGLCCLAASVACSKGESDSIVYVSVTAPATMPAASQLIVGLSGAANDVERFPEVNAGTPINFVPEASFVLVIPRSLSGDLFITVDAVDAASQPVGQGEDATTIKVGGRVDVRIALDLGGPADAGAGDALPSVDGSVADQRAPGDAFGIDLPVVAGTGGAATGGTTGTPGGAGGRTGAGGTGGLVATGGSAPAGGSVGSGGLAGMGGVSAGGGAGGGSGGNPDGGGDVAKADLGPDVPSGRASCGNGKIETGESCDCGTDPANLPSGCRAPNGIFYGDGMGCSKTCTKEPSCRDSVGLNQSCIPVCGDGHVDPSEACDDGNQLDADGCSSLCQVESGFSCATETVADGSPCRSGTGTCLELPVIYRDFQPENVPGGHPDFPFLGTRYNGSTSPTTICVPESSGPSKGLDSVSRCWGMANPNLLKGKPQAGGTLTCACQFSDWSIGNSSRIPGGYTQAANDSPLSDGNGGYQGGTAGTIVNTTSSAGVYSGILVGYNSGTPAGPIWRGSVPAYKSAASFQQWYTDDATVNQTFYDVLELPAIGSGVYQYASQVHLAQGGFFPLDTLNPSQATLCDLWPYWNHGNGTPIWSTCRGDQYLFPPYVVQSDCPTVNPLSNGCWVTGIAGVKHDYAFTMEAHYYFAYDPSGGLTLKFYVSNDLFAYINGIQVLDLGGTHTPLPGQVTLAGDPGDAQVIEGGCLDTAGNITGVTAGSTACSPTSGSAVKAASPDDFRVRSVALGLTPGRTYELAIFGAQRHPTGSNFQLSFTSLTTKRSVCAPN
jgi:cysteine-rich repeat protein